MNKKGANKALSTGENKSKPKVNGDGALTASVSCLSDAHPIENPAIYQGPSNLDQSLLWKAGIEAGVFIPSLARGLDNLLKAVSTEEVYGSAQVWCESCGYVVPGMVHTFGSYITAYMTNGLTRAHPGGYSLQAWFARHFDRYVGACPVCRAWNPAASLRRLTRVARVPRLLLVAIDVRNLILDDRLSFTTYGEGRIHRIPGTDYQLATAIYCEDDMFTTRSRSKMVSRVQTSSLFAMPVEVLAQILLLGCGEFDNEPMFFIGARLQFGRVCALWRDVICRDARFWSHVFIGDHRTLAVLPSWLSRSKEAQLHLFVDTGTYVDNWRHFDAVFSSLVQVVPSILHRVARFSLWDGYGDRGSVVLHWLNQLAASNVQRLDIFAKLPTIADARVVERGRGRWGGRSVDLSKPSTPLHLIPSAPLVSLVVHHAFLVLHPSMLSGLRNLRLGPIPSHHRLTWDSMRSMLLSCTVLSLFVCDDVRCGYGTFQECELLNLTHFRLVCRNSSGEKIFTALRLPSLRVLSLDGYTPRLSYGAMTTSLASNVGRPKDTQSELLCPSLALIHFSATVTAIEAAQLLSPTPPAIFSPSCVVSYVPAVVLTAVDVDRVGGSFRVIEGVMEATDHALPVVSHFEFGAGFCE
ncbi:hypothetical protein R3P38DRAFT_2812568 [Favolaschia claudopus]|uniref:F-box domain-containing protein n=1 Tax=Favolaschia claudopus TaxID=2862362 RepID=A0AAV9Z721_9AGAR